MQYRSVISDIFDGKILSSVQCLTCERVRKGILAHDLDHCWKENFERIKALSKRKFGKF